MEIKYIFYFLFGGITVSTVTYLASHSKGLLAAFFANLPVITFTTFLMIYFESGQAAVVTYAKGLIIMLLPWLAYIFAIVFLTQRIGIMSSLGIGISLYFLLAYLLINMKR